MNVFQITVICVLTLAVVFDTIGFVRSRRTRGMWFARTTMWLTTALAVMFPQAAQTVADLLGIRRGADLVFYVFVIAMTFVTFHLYGRNRSMEIRMTELVRIEALRTARSEAQQNRESV